MAESAKVKRTDVFEPSIFPTKEAKEFNDLLKDTAEGFASVLTTQQAIIETRKGNVKTFEDIKKIDKAIRDSQKARALYNTAIKEQIALEIKEEQLKQQKLRTAKAENAEKDKQAKATEKLKMETDKLSSAYAQESKRLVELKKRVKDILASEKELTEQDKKLIKETQLLDDKLKKIDKTIGDGHRSVGLYADGIKEAIAGTRLFDSELAHTLVQLKSLSKQWRENTDGSNKFTNALKLGAVGLAIIAAAAAKALFDAGKNTSQVVSDSVEKASILFGIQKGIDAAARSAAKLAGDETGSLERATALRLAYVDILRQTNKELEKIGFAQQQFTLDEEDFRDIAADNTIGFEARNEALAEAQRLEKLKIDKEFN